MSMMRSNKKEKFQEIGYDFPLHDLPDGIVIDILERLNSSAKLRFSAVCRAWKCLLRRLLPFLASEANQFPWLVTYDSQNKSLILVETCPASYQKSCSEIKLDLNQEPFFASIPAYGLTPLDVQFGWIAFQSGAYNRKPESIFLYSPFTRKFIPLPDLPDVCVYNFAMSHPPTCSDCVFISFGYNFRQKRTNAYTCGHGDKKWKKHDILSNSAIYGLMFCAGRFYCIVGLATFAAFDVASESWQVLGRTPTLIPGDHLVHQLVESAGDVLLVGHSNLEWNSNGPFYFNVWKYEGPGKGWTKMKTLSRRLLCLQFSMGGMAVFTAGELESLADRIYFARKYPYYFSLQDGRLHSCPFFDVGESYAYWIMPPSLQV